MAVTTASSRFANYTVRTLEDAPLRVELFEQDRQWVRIHFLAYRVPSKREFQIRHFADATSRDRAHAERWSGTIPHGGWDAIPASAVITKRRHQEKGFYYWVVRLGHVVEDPFRQLELEMMIDRERSTEPAETALGRGGESR